MTNAQYRKLIGEMGDLFCRFKEEEAREGRTEALDAAQPPERVWECLYTRAGCPNCGLCPRDRHIDGKPAGWHRDCWSAYQIKALRGMVETLREFDIVSEYGGLKDKTWQQIDDQFAELYPERNDDD